MTGEAGLWNVANLLTMVRIVLVPVFVACLLAGGTAWRLAALATFCIASLTDLLDGGWPAAAGWSPTSARSPTRWPTRR